MMMMMMMMMIFECFSKICQENSRSVKISQQYRILHMKANIHLRSHLAQFPLELQMFQTSVVEKIETHISCSVT